MTHKEAKKRAEEWKVLLNEADRQEEEEDDPGMAEECRIDAGEIADELREAGYDDPQALIDED
jgi:hypothetical protein